MFPFFVKFIRISCVSVSQVIALPFLPAEHISAAFDALMAQATTFALVDLMGYIQRNWLRSPVWTTESWSVYNQSVRTNNDVEGWHHRVNHRGNGTAPPFYRLVPLLFTEAQLVPIISRFICEKKLKRYQRKRYRGMQGEIFELWAKYAANDISTSQLLKSCGNVYAPTLSNK